ncbi:MAG: hypothetical protein ACYC06_05525 [Ilumatobacteraceae bacterium]
MLLGQDLLGWLVFAFGAAMCVGNVLAIMRPPAKRREDSDLERAPIGRSITMAIVGGLAALWALASLIRG